MAKRKANFIGPIPDKLDERQIEYEEGRKLIEVPIALTPSGIHIAHAFDHFIDPKKAFAIKRNYERYVWVENTYTLLGPSKIRNDDHVSYGLALIVEHCVSPRMFRPVNINLGITYSVDELLVKDGENEFKKWLNQKEFKDDEESPSEANLESLTKPQNTTKQTYKIGSGTFAATFTATLKHLMPLWQVKDRRVEHLATLIYEKIRESANLPKH